MSQADINSIAVWLDEREDSESSGSSVIRDFHLDVNLWATDELNDSYIEIGFKISNWFDLGKITCYLPLAVASTVYDKSIYLKNKHSALEALLNESLDLRAFKDDERFVVVDFHDKKDGKKNNLILFTPGKNLSCSRQDSGRSTRIEIRLPSKAPSFREHELAKDTRLYVRLRFKTSDLGSIVRVKKSPSWLFNGASERITFVDFRVNALRSLPSGLKVKAKSSPITSVNFFLMTDAWNKIEIETVGDFTSRLLESHIWNEYLSDMHLGRMTNKKLRDQIVAYHWKRELGSDNRKGYNIFIKLYRNYSSKRTALYTILWLIFAGAVGSILAGLWSNN